MYSGRYFPVKKKATIVIDKRFSVFEEIEAGDRGQVIIEGIVEGERLDSQDDGTELFTKKIKILNTKLLGNKPLRK